MEDMMITIGLILVIGFASLISIIQSEMRKIGKTLQYTNRYLLMIVEKKYSVKEIHEETEDLRG